MRSTGVGARWRAVIVAACAVMLAATVMPQAGSIVGGSPVAPNVIGFAASLQHGGSHFCGGTVISNQWVLTAAHCATGFAATWPEDLTIVTGRLALPDERVGQRIQVAEVRVHPQYRRSDLANDVALMRLAVPTSAAAVRLAGAGDDRLEADGAPLTVVGWGTSIFMVPLLPGQLQQVQVDVIADSRCQAMYGLTALLSGSTHPSTQVCAGNFLADSCQGDSGGPLFAGSGAGAVQVGVVSWGWVCGLPTNPGVYAEVNAPSIRSWIAAQTGI